MNRSPFLCIFVLASAWTARGLSIDNSRTPPSIDISLSTGQNVPFNQPLDSLKKHHHRNRRFILQKGASALLSASFLPINNAAAAQPTEFVEVGQQQSPPVGEQPFAILPNGVQIKDFRQGSSSVAVQKGSKVELTLKGRLLNLNGVIFYDTKSVDPNGFGEGTPLQFTVGDGTALPGLESGIMGMTKGGIRRIIVPAEEGYGKFPELEPRPFTVEERRALESVVKNPRRDGTVMFDVKLERVR